MFYRIVIFCLVLAAFYALYQIWSLNSYYSKLRTPVATFTTVEKDGNQNPLTIVEFMHYDCEYCKDTHAVLLEYAKTTPEIRLVTRPVPFEGGGAQLAAERALAAGLQGKFWELDSALTQHKAPMDEKFYRESTALYNIDYDRMVADAGGEEVRKMAEDNVAAVLTAGISSTPALMVGKTIYEPRAPLTMQDFLRMVHDEQAK